MKSRLLLSALSCLLLLAGCGQPPEPVPETPRLDKVSVTCTPAALTAGQSAQCAASAVDQKGEPFSVSAYTWTSGDESIARVDASGKVATVAVSSGSVAIRARATSGDSSQQGEASLSVTPKAPTVHSTSVTSAETWKAQDNPHLVSGALAVDAPLTLEAGAVIRFAPDAELKVTRGALQAAGTAQAPVLLQAEKGGKGAWKGVVLAAKDSASSLEYTTLSGCGGTQGAGACLVIRDGAAPVLKDVTVRDSGGLGVLVATADSAFGPGSTRLSIFNSAGTAVRLDANQAGTLPAGGTFADNAPNVVELTGSRVSRTQTWPKPPAAYLINGRLDISDASAPALLTLSAGTVVRFGAGAFVIVGYDDKTQGGLILDGTAEAPILLTAHADNPQPGHWSGVHVVTTAPQAGRISHATIEYAGKAQEPDDFYLLGTGNLNLYTDYSTDKSSFTATDLLVRKSSGPGLVLFEDGKFAEGSARVTSRDNATHPVMLAPNEVRALPKDSDFKNNGINAIALLFGGVSDTQTWANLGVPYLLTDIVSLGSSSNPTLTLPAGTEIQFTAKGALLVAQSNSSPGALVAVGTQEAPVRFVPDTAAAPDGYWSGLHFWKATGSRLKHVLITHGGKPLPSSYGNVVSGGNLNVHADIGVFATDSTFKHATSCTISVDDGLNHLRFDRPEDNNVFVDNVENYQCFN